MTRFKKTESGELFGSVAEIKDILSYYDGIASITAGERDVRAKIGDSKLLVRIGYDMKGNPSIWANLTGNGGYATRLLHDADTWEEDLAAWLDEKVSTFNDPSKKEEATKFGAGMSKKTDFSKCRNMGDILEVLEDHRRKLETAAADMDRSKEAIAESVETLKEFSEYADLLKQQSVKGIKKALSMKNSPEVQAAAEVEKALKGALSIIASDYNNIPDIEQLMTVIDSRYATRGSKILTTVQGQMTHAVEVDYKTIKDSIASGDIEEDDVLKMATVTQVVHGVKDKGVVTKLSPILARMNAMVDAASKLEEAVIDPKEFEELRDVVKQLVAEASTPTETIRTTIVALDDKTLASIRTEARVHEGILDKIKDVVSVITNKLARLWDSFTSLFFAIEDEALESADIFNEIELGLALAGISVTESYKVKNTFGKQFEVLTKSVLTCCDNLVKDASLAGEFDDEVIYAEDAVKNAIESFQVLGGACKTLKKALESHKNEDNMNVIGILADAITQIVADDAGSSVGGSSEEDDEGDSIIDQVEREYSPNIEDDTGMEGDSEAPNLVGMEEPEEF